MTHFTFTPSLIVGCDIVSNIECYSHNARAIWEDIVLRSSSFQSPSNSQARIVVIIWCIIQTFERKLEVSHIWRKNRRQLKFWRTSVRMPSQIAHCDQHPGVLKKYIIFNEKHLDSVKDIEAVISTICQQHLSPTRMSRSQMRSLFFH